MTTDGKIAIAPCGHTGETIIGNYVRCLVGCEGKASASARGVPGHVLDCACKPCQIRRRTTHIVLRDKNGRDWLKVPWDGVSNTIAAKSDVSGDLRGFRLLDVDGNIVAQGSTEAVILPGNLTIRVSHILDLVTMNSGIIGGLVHQSTADQLDYITSILLTGPLQTVQHPVAPLPRVIFGPGGSPGTPTIKMPPVVKGP